MTNCLATATTLKEFAGRTNLRSDRFCGSPDAGVAAPEHDPAAAQRRPITAQDEAQIQDEIKKHRAEQPKRRA
jgi:hypothetical protein